MTLLICSKTMINSPVFICTVTSSSHVTRVTSESHACFLAQHVICARQEVCLCVHVVHACLQISVMCLTIYRSKPGVIVVVVAFVIHRLEIFLTSVFSKFPLPTKKNSFCTKVLPGILDQCSSMKSPPKLAQFT